MRNTKTGEALQGICTPQTLQGLTLVSENFKNYHELQELEERFQTLLYAWIGSDLIEDQKKNERENTFSFLDDLQTFLKSFYNDNSKSKNELEASFINFFDHWDIQNFEPMLDKIREGYFFSDVADHRDERIEMFWFLRHIERAIKEISALKN